MAVISEIKKRNLKLKKSNIIYLSLQGLIALSINSCIFIGDQPAIYDRLILKDIHLVASNDINKLTLYHAYERGGYLGIINPSIYEIGWSDDFIIAKSNPYLRENIEFQILSSYLDSNYITIVKDSLMNIYKKIDNNIDVSNYDSNKIHRKDNQNWYLTFEHIRADSLAPFKGLTFWHIVAVKNNRKHYKLYSEKDFLNKRKELMVNDTLSFFMDLKNLK